MKFSKPTLLTVAIVSSLTVGGVAAAMSDVQLIPGNPAQHIERPQPPKEEPVVNPTIEETPVSDTADDTSNSDNVSSPETPTQTPVNEVTPNEPTPEAVEYDPTPEPLPAPDTNNTHVSNPNTSLGNDTAGTVSHN